MAGRVFRGREGAVESVAVRNPTMLKSVGRERPNAVTYLVQVCCSPSPSPSPVGTEAPIDAGLAPEHPRAHHGFMEAFLGRVE